MAFDPVAGKNGGGARNVAGTHDAGADLGEFLNLALSAAAEELEAFALGREARPIVAGPPP